LLVTDAAHKQTIMRAKSFMHAARYITSDLGPYPFGGAGTNAFETSRRSRVVACYRVRGWFWLALSYSGPEVMPCTGRPMPQAAVKRVSRSTVQAGS
jgi:hypothetical protein